MTTTATIRAAFRRHGIRARARDFSSVTHTRVRVVFDELYSLQENPGEKRRRIEILAGYVNLVAGELGFADVTGRPFSWSNFNNCEVMLYRRK